MVGQSLLVAVVVGVVQGVVEWLPISSEASVTILLAALRVEPRLAVRLALILHAGTAVAATAYYREDFLGAALDVPAWRPANAFGADGALVTFLAGATLVSGVVGVGAYVLLIDLATALAGGAFVALIGGLLVVTGIVQRAATSASLGDRELPDGIDVLLVGVGQGLAVLPGISRSGTTASVLLLRGHDGESAFRLSFLLSVPAALGAAALAIADIGGVPSIPPAAGGVALIVSAGVGYLTIDALMRVVRRVAFWAVCVGLGAIAIAGGVLVTLA